MKNVTQRLFHIYLINVLILYKRTSTNPFWLVLCNILIMYIVRLLPPVRPQLRNFGGLIWGWSRGPTGTHDSSLERGRSEFSNAGSHVPLAQREVPQNRSQKSENRDFRDFCKGQKSQSDISFKYKIIHGWSELKVTSLLSIKFGSMWWHHFQV